MGDSPVEEDSLAAERLLAVGDTPVAEGNLAEADSPAEGDKPVAADRRHLADRRVDMEDQRGPPPSPPRLKWARREEGDRFREGKPQPSSLILFRSPFLRFPSLFLYLRKVSSLDCAFKTWSK